jgi:2-aminoethylphosphonate-pyruvate transaminase
MDSHPTTTDKLLFTPGPLTTSSSVKAAMLRDLGSRDTEFINAVRDIRRRLLALAGQADDSRYTAVLMQGSGTFGIESVISSAVPPDGKLLILINGAYGKRMAQIAGVLNIPVRALVTPENTLHDLAALDAALAEDPKIQMVAVVHCETTTGILNPVEQIAAVVKRHQRLLFVDAMSSFGAVPIDIGALGIDYLVSSSNKCIEGVPGFSFILAKKDALLQTEGYTRSVSLDLLAQYKGLEQDGQFRFTPPTHALLAFHQALLELEAEGGVAGRAERYRNNHEVLVDGMRRLGFQTYLPAELQGYIITTFLYPQHPNFNFQAFYNRLSEAGCVIYPGKLTNADCFRIGNIGRLHADDIRALLDAIAAVKAEMDFT